MAKAPKQTPMMAQYHRLKGELPGGALLLFRLGDFYELFFDDAKVGADILNITLTKRGSTPMCGIPFHAADNYIGKLLQAGCKVAMCEQTEEAVPGKLVNREVTQILSPGTHFDEQILTAERNNYLAALSRQGKVFGLAVIDLTTGDFRTTEVDSPIALQAELERLKPAEIVHPTGENRLFEALGGIRAVVNEQKIGCLRWIQRSTPYATILAYNRSMALALKDVMRPPARRVGRSIIWRTRCVAT